MKAFAEFYVLEYIKHFERSLFMDNKAPLLSSKIASLSENGETFESEESLWYELNNGWQEQPPQVVRNKEVASV